MDDFRPRSRNSNMSEEEIAEQAILDKNQQRLKLFAERKIRLPVKRLRSNNSSGDQEYVDDKGFTLVRRKAHRVATGNAGMTVKEKTTMTPAQQSEAPTSTTVLRPAVGNSVVISGMSGLYPKSRYVRDLENVLYNKINPITSDDVRWKYNHPEAAQYAGNVPDLDRFDAQFFKVHFRLGNSMDSMSRKVLEQAYEAIYDAGVNPGDLSGKKVGVYIGTCFSETEKACFYVATSRTGFGIAGCNKSMFANRISYWLNAKGPSHSIDDACCSSTVALEQAYLAISRGECEAAIVGGANLCLHPQSSVHYGRIMNLSRDGKTKSFDQEASGCAKSEAINVLFLQKAKDAFRIYAHLVNVQCEFVRIPDGETGPKFGFYRDPEDTARFLKMFYDTAGIAPQVVEYVEGFGSAVPEADKSELEAFDKIFCNNRDAPLLVGSVMSNIGYGEAASGISAITKVLLGYHRGELAGNLNCITPRKDVAAIKEGRIQVLNDNHQFRRTYAAVNSMSVTGVNAHVLLHGHNKPKNHNRYKSNIPHLVIISGRQDSSVVRAFDELKSSPIDPEQLALLQNIHQTRIVGHLGRGYAVFDTKDGKTVSLSEQVDYFDDAQRPLWFVYSGMGSQWAGMATQLMRFPIFTAAIERCRQVLEPKGLDIVHIITSPEKTIFDNILHSFVGIAAVQIGLTDLLTELGLVPDKIIGHSVGELGCAYADGCLTAEEMILSAYSRGLVSLETPFIKGSMAAVGLGFEEVSKLCPPEIEIACHNSAESCTISGPADAMQSFVSELVTKGIFAKEVPCSNIAYHSRYIAKAGPGLLKYLKEVIQTPKVRSEKWVSTSVPQDRWDEDIAKYSSAEYHTNNLLSPVLFEETSKLIPSNAVLVEIAPHGLLQAILKRSLPDSCTNIPLTRRGHPDSPRMVLEAVGKLYMGGYNPKVQVLYPKVEFPVSAGTPYLSHLVDWAHNEKWTLPLYVSAHRINAASCKFLVSVNDDDHTYLKGHVIRNKMQVPFSYALVAVWDTLAMTLKVPKKQLNVVFSDVHLHAQPVLHDQQSIKLIVSLHRGTGRFEVMDDNFKVATGFITRDDNPNLKLDVQNSEDVIGLNSRDVYQLFYEREYTYSGKFRSIHKVNDTLSRASILWSDNWVTFIDGLIQLNAIKQPHSAVSEARLIRRMAIDVTEHLKHIINEDDVTVIKAHVRDVNDLTRCGGVIIENLKFRNLPTSKEKQVELKTLRFVPRFGSNIDAFTALQIFTQIVAENINKDIINIVGISSQLDDETIFDEMKRVASINGNQLTGTIINYQTVTNIEMSKAFERNVKEADIILVQNLLNDNEFTRILQHSSRSDVFIVNDALNATMDIKTDSAFKIVSVLTDKKKGSHLQLVRFQPTLPVTSTSVVVRSEKDLPTLIAARSKLLSQNNLIVLSTYPPISGLKSLVKHWRRDSSRNSIHLVMVNNSRDSKNLAKIPGGLAYSLLDNGVWGGEYYLPLQESLENGGKIILRSENIGKLESLKWVQAPALTNHGVSVKVHYAGINMNDVLRATGVIPNKSYDIGYGMEFSGVTESGERVMGLVPDGAVQSHVIAQPEFMWPVPSHWNLEDAATVPLAYLYAYYISLHVKRLEINGKNVCNVLVHGGAGALGQAMISVCLYKGYRVFTTVSDVHKKKFLVKLFPKLKEEDIGNSRDASFADMVLNATCGRGCDIIVCCLKGDLKNVSLKCGSHSGMIYDTVQILNQENFNFGMYYLSQEKHYISVDISSVFFNPKAVEVKILQMLVSEGIASGVVRPLSRVTYAPQDVSRAFRLLAASRHRGRVLIQLQDQHPSAQPRLSCSENGCHIIFCDDQPLGLQLADMLISSGAKKIHLHFVQAQTHLSFRQRVWKKQNVQVSISSEVLNDEIDYSNLFQKIITTGSIDGVYLAAEYILKNTMLTTLDLIVRKLCPSLKNFLVFSAGDDSAQFIAIQRARDGLPATVVNLSMLEIVNDEAGLTWYRGIKEVAERALLSVHPVLLAQLKHLPRASLIQQIAALANITITEQIDGTTLEDFGIRLDESQAISVFLKNEYNIKIDEADIPSILLESIKQIENRFTDTKFEDVKGLGTFYSFVDPDELLATTELVFMPTRTTNSTSRDDEFDMNETFMCIVPGLEGHHRRFSSLCEQLKLPALVLQPGLDHLQETVEELALRYSKVVLKRAGMKNNFYILGVETGILVALELAAILEQRGQTGTVFCIGDGPEEIKSLMKEHLREYNNEEALQIGLVQHMFTLMTGAGAGSIENVAGVTWRQRVDTCVRTLLGQVPHSAQYARALIEAAHARIVSTISYNATPKSLKSNIVLFRALSPHAASTVPCSLQRYSQQPISVHNLTTPLAHVTNDMRCASIINRHLSKELLEAFDGKNLCESYLLNADTFMSTSEG